ncbi:MAG: RluA family pseudouridine synthase [Bacteroidales bacterium]|nr:RluA family pseudouridine synthase [Bacteroidales bacterium]
MSNSASGAASAQVTQLPEKFTYPFCYMPHPLVAEAAANLCRRIGSDPGLHSLFAEGKMMGVLMVGKPGGGTDFLYGFSGLAGGRSIVEGFVPPIFDTTAVDIDSGSHEESVRLQEWLFGQYIVSNARGEQLSIKDIFARSGLVPPGGTGDCAAPKLLQYAYGHGLKPLAMGEFWYGASPASEVRRQGAFYPSCTGKCGPLLGFMLQGLDVEPNPLDCDHLWQLGDPVIHFEDSSIVVVDKPAGMLSVPGRTSRGNLLEWLSQRCGCHILECHRLDMDTSGLMVFAKTPEAQAAIRHQFEGREVRKQYLARLCPAAADAKGPGSLSPRPLKPGESGKISLPLMLDYYDRPRQKVDFENGKPAVTDYEVLRELPGGILEVRFTPYTGRTHQLRVHAAHPLGLGRPILGDRLYGGQMPGTDRLMLHSSLLAFRHPVTGSRMRFESGL